MDITVDKKTVENVEQAAQALIGISEKEWVYLKYLVDMYFKHRIEITHLNMTEQELNKLLERVEFPKKVLIDDGRGCSKKNLFEELEKTVLIMNEKIQGLLQNDYVTDELEIYTNAIRQILEPLLFMKRQKTMSKSNIKYSKNCTKNYTGQVITNLANIIQKDLADSIKKDYGLF